MKFSQRIGKTDVRSAFQLEEMDKALRNRVWNVLAHRLFPFPSNASISARQFSTQQTNMVRRIWDDFFKLTFEEIPNRGAEISLKLRSTVVDDPWFRVYDFLEFVFYILADGIDKVTLESSLNLVLEKEMSGYRIVRGIVTPITNQFELDGIESALKTIKKEPLSGVEEHLQTALRKLSDRKNPDFRNSIKESISAVEGTVQLLVGKPNASLGKALKMIDESVGIHTTLRDGFRKIYGYTSSEDGIRHAMLANPNIEFEDAKYMLVACSAFVNYLVAKAHKAHIELS